MKTIDRLLREAIQSANHASAIRVRKGDFEILANWTPENGWYRLGVVEDCEADLIAGDGGRIRDGFTAEAKAYREAIGAPEPAPRKPTPKMTAEEQADFDQYWDRVQAERRKQDAADRIRQAAEIEAARLAIEARKNPKPTPAPVKSEPPQKRNGYSFPF